MAIKTEREREGVKLTVGRTMHLRIPVTLHLFDFATLSALVNVCSLLSAILIIYCVNCIRCILTLGFATWKLSYPTFNTVSSLY